MITTELRRQLGFVLEADRLKRVLRQSLISNGSRRENSAEHSWHVAVAALVLVEHAAEPDLDVSRVVRMLLLHDLVEIDAGDAYLYDEDAQSEKAALEERAAERLFALLPPEQGDDLLALWREFEARQSPEARFCAAIDRLLPVMLNHITEGASWKRHRIRRSQVVAKCRHMAEGAPSLWAFARALIDESVQKGYLLP